MRESDKQIVDQPRHAPSLRLHDAEEPVARGRIVARRPLQRVDESGDGRKRRAKLVADIGDEVGAHAVGAADRREIMDGDDDDPGAAGTVAAERNGSDKRLRPAWRRQPRGELDALRLAGLVCGADRLDQFRHAERNRRRLAAAQRRRERGGLGIEGDDAAVLIEHRHRIGHSGDHRIEQDELRRNAGGTGLRLVRGNLGALIVARAQEAAQPDEPALPCAAIIDRRHCVVPPCARPAREYPT